MKKGLSLLLFWLLATAMPRAEVVSTAGLVYVPDTTQLQTQLALRFIDENGDERLLPYWYHTITDRTTTLTQGWWVVTGDVQIDSRIEVIGTVNILLTDGSTLKANAGIHAGETTRLNVYSQKQGTGTLWATGTASSAGIGGKIHEESGVFTFNGGIIHAVGDNDAAGIGGGANSNWSGVFGNNQKVIINGGEVYAHSPGNGAGIGGGGSSSSSYVVRPGNGGEIIVNGGRVTATSASGYGMGPGKGVANGNIVGEKGTISLSWRDEHDYVMASSFHGNITHQRAFSLNGTTSLATTDDTDSCMLSAAHKMTFLDTDAASVITDMVTPAGRTFAQNETPTILSGYKTNWQLDGQLYDFNIVPRSDLQLVATEWYMRGDLDNNGKVDVSDVNSLINIILGSTNLLQYGQYGQHAFVTDDYNIDVTDVNAIINIILNK